MRKLICLILLCALVLFSCVGYTEESLDHTSNPTTAAGSEESSSLPDNNDDQTGSATETSSLIGWQLIETSYLTHFNIP